MPNLRRCLLDSKISEPTNLGSYTALEGVITAEACAETFQERFSQMEKLFKKLRTTLWHAN